MGSSSADSALLRSGMRSESSSAAPLPLPYSTPTCDHGLRCCRCMHSLLPTSFPTPACHHGLQALPLHPLHASSAAALLNSSTPSAPSSAAIRLPALPLCASSAAPFSTTACHQGLPALPLHVSSAAALPHSGMLSMPSSAVFHYVAALCCIALSHYVLEVPGGYSVCYSVVKSVLCVL